jgi:hypothetical protein
VDQIRPYDEDKGTGPQYMKTEFEYITVVP